MKPPRVTLRLIVALVLASLVFILTWVIFSALMEDRQHAAAPRIESATQSQTESRPSLGEDGTTIRASLTPREQLTGVVLNREGRPVQGAAVEAIACEVASLLRQRTPADFDRRHAGLRRTVSDSRGRFVLDGIARDLPHELVATSPEGGASLAPVLAGQDIEVRLGLVRAVTGVVQNEMGQGIANAQLELAYVFGNRSDLTRGVSQSDGSFTFAVPISLPSSALLVRLRVDAAGYFAEFRNLAIRDVSTESHVIVVMLNHPGERVGQVIDQRTSLPIEGATIRCGFRRFDMTRDDPLIWYGFTDLSWSNIDKVSTDGEGRFRIFPLGDSNRSRTDRLDFMLIEAKGYVSRCFRLPLLEGEQIVELSPAIRLVGRVQNQRGSPLVNALVQVQEKVKLMRQEFASESSWYQYTDSHGDFEFDSVIAADESGPITVRAIAEYGAGTSADATVSISNLQRGVLTAPTIVIRERLKAIVNIVDDATNAPILSATLVPLGGWSSTWVSVCTPRTGRIELLERESNSISSEVARFSVHAPGYGSLDGSIQLDAQNPPTLDMRMKAGFPVSGRVQWRDGVGAPASLFVVEDGFPESEESLFSPDRVMNYWTTPGVVARANTTDDGHFEIPPLSKGIYRLLGTHRNAVRNRSGPPARFAMTFEVPLKEELVANIGPLEARTGEFEVRGTVLRTDGRPLTWAGTVLIHSEALKNFGARVPILNGGFRCRGLSRGKWRFIAEVEGHSSEPTELHIDETSPAIIECQIHLGKGVTTIIDLTAGTAPLVAVAAVKLRSRDSLRTYVAKLDSSMKSTEPIQLEPDSEYIVTIDSFTPNQLVVPNPSALRTPKSGDFRPSFVLEASAPIQWDLPRGDVLRAHATNGVSVCDLVIFRKDGTKVFEDKAWKAPRALPCGPYRLVLTPPNGSPHEVEFDVRWNSLTHVQLKT